jgi:hypothetical protein
MDDSETSLVIIIHICESKWKCYPAKIIKLDINEFEFEKYNHLKFISEADLAAFCSTLRFWIIDRGDLREYEIASENVANANILDEAFPANLRFENLGNFSVNIEQISKERMAIAGSRDEKWA